MKHAVRNSLIGVGVIGLIALWLRNEEARKGVPKIYYRTKPVSSYNAQTLPPFGIFINADQAKNKALLQHELIHWKQYQKMGLLRYYTQYIREFNKHGYDRMPMETAARINETPLCKKNYTQCVQAGVSKTVFNPMFRS